MKLRIAVFSAVLPVVIAFSAAHAQKVQLPAKPTPNQKSMAAYLQKVCTQLAIASNPSSASNLTAEQRDLAQRCLFFENPELPATPAGAAALGNGYSAILGQQINALGPQTKKFGTLQQDNLAARLAELRHGARGASFSGLSVTADDGTVVAGNDPGSSGFLPEGASGDGNGGWLDGKLGVFVNGSVKDGSKRKTTNGFALDISDDSATFGADYRVGAHFVFGAAVGSGNTKIDFANSLGRLDLHSTGVSVYASLYGSTYYVDLVAGYGRPNLDLARHIQYTESPGAGTVDQDAYGRSHLRDIWTGISMGRPLYWRALTLTPEGSLNFHEIRLDSFTESMSSPNGPGSGLALTYGSAVVPSLQGRAGLRGAYTFSGAWGVVEPNLHSTFIREFRSHSDYFSAQFANAPPGSGSFILQTDPPEGHYIAIGAGLNFQLAHGISGFVDYEKLEKLKAIKSREFSFGVRYQFGI